MTREAVSLDDLLPEQSPPRQTDPSKDVDVRLAHRQLEQISAAAETFSLELDLTRLLARIADQAEEILRAEQVVVYSNHDGRLKAEVVLPESMPGTNSPGPAVQRAIKHLKPQLDNAPTAATARNTLCVPLVSTQNRVLAVIEAHNKSNGGLFTEQDLRVAVCLARVACSAVDRALLFHRIEEWRQSMETLLSFNATINQQLEPSELVRELVANVTGFLDAAGGAAGVVIVEDANPIAVSESIYFDGQTHPCHRRWQRNQGIPGVVLETQFPLLINDYQQNPLADSNLARQFNIGSCICVPIKNAKEEVLGFFKLHRHVGEPEFTWQDAAFLETLGNTAAVAIENARLVRSLELKNEQIKNLSQNHVRRLEMERQHIARELHDQTGQVLVGLKLRLQVLSGLLNDQQSDAKQELAALRAQLNESAGQLKNLAKRLRPPTLDELGFEASIRQLVSEYRRQSDFSMRVDFRVPPELDSEAETALYRIAQESLTNIAKHSDARCVIVCLEPWQGGQRFSIRDDGVGFDPDLVASGLGLIGIKERVKMLDGTVRIVSGDGRGTSIEIMLPERSSP